MRRAGGYRIVRLHTLFAVVFLICLLAGQTASLANSPFKVSATTQWINGSPAIRIDVGVPQDHYIYADDFSVRLEGDIALDVAEAMRPRTVFDKFSEEERDVYDRDFSMVYLVAEPVAVATVIVGLQGCDDAVCFFPETHRFNLQFSETTVGPDNQEVIPSDALLHGADADWRSLADRYSVTARDTGFLRQGPLLEFLDRGLSGADVEDALTARFRRLGMSIAVLLILLGGAGLNLTPCVLPLVPINLAIIGAGAKAGSRGRGFLLGAAYGLGMAFVYGLLGLVAVLTGSTFGALNASPWFNLGIAVIFVVLSLAMFDVFTIDFTRFQGTAGAAGKGHVLAVFGMGAIAALLAGACVAPVVISVLLLSGTLYNQGNVFALLLPFLLGVGMALPWPFAGAGMGLLPKPGKWMNYVKYGFGVLILGFALYYGRLAYTLFQARASMSGLDAEAVVGGERGSDENSRLAALLGEGLRAGKPVFIDFWATWCKNCIAMERSTFQEPGVKDAFEKFVVVKYQAERPNDAATKEVLDYFEVVGLPTYVVLVPEEAGPTLR